MSRPVRTRYAPSPTGYQHIGGIRTALHCYLFTRNMGGTFILRIEDTDRSRYLAEAEDYIIESLKWCGIECDEGVHVGGDYGPYRQSERKDLYKVYVQQLLDSGHAYYAFDTPEELTEMRESFKTDTNPSPKYDRVTRMKMKNSLTMSKEEVDQWLADGCDYVVRIQIPEDEKVVVTDIIRGEVVFDSNELDDKVLMKADGMPTYHMANVVDDHLMKISHVIRGEEWLSSTPLHVVLYRSLGWEDTMPEFAHLPLILKPTGKGKLSKRDGDKLGFPVFPIGWVSEKGFRERGFIPDAFVNFMVFLGWNPGTEQEIFSRQQLVDAFSLDRISKSGARFDFDKAKWFNEQYIKLLSDEALAEMAMVEVPEKYNDLDKGFVAQACGLMKERLTFVNDLWTTGYYFFEKPNEYDGKVIRKRWKEDRPQQFVELRNRLTALEDFSAAGIEATVKQFMADHELGFGDVLQLFRVMLAGTMKGPSIFDMAAVLGKEETVARMEHAEKEFDELGVGS